MEFLEIGIDSSQAKTGADVFAQAGKKISNSADDVDQHVRKAEASIDRFGRAGIKDPAFARGLKDLDNNLEKSIRNIDRQLSILEGGGGKAAKGLDTFEKATGHARSQAGQFIGQLAQGDLGGTLGEIAQMGGGAAAALIGFGLAAGAGVFAVVKMTGAMIELVRETDKLAKDSKLTSQQIQGLQVVANLTGESIDDLAENYKKIAPEVRTFEGLVASTGAAIDQDLREKTQGASLAWEELKLRGQGALNAIAREALPEVNNLLREMGILLSSVNWKGFGEGAASALRNISAAFEVIKENGIIGTLAKSVGFTPGGLVTDFLSQKNKLASQDQNDRGLGVDGAGIARLQYPSRLPSFKKEKKAAAPESLATPPDETGSLRALRNAELANYREIEQEKLEMRLRGLEAERKAFERELSDNKISYQTFADKITEIDQDVLRYQKTSILERITEERKALVDIEREKLDSIARINEKENNALRGKSATQAAAIENRRAAEIRIVNNQVEADKLKHVGNIAKLENQIVKASDFATAAQIENAYKLQKANEAVEQTIIKLFAKYAEFKREQNANAFKVGQQGAQDRTDTARTNLAAQEEAISRAVESRIISEAEGQNRLSTVRKAAAPVLKDLIDLEIKYALIRSISDPAGAEKELANLQRQKTALEDLTKTLNAAQIRIRQFGDDAKSVLKDAFYQGIVEGPRAFFQTLLKGFQSLLAQLASELLTSQFVKLLGSLGKGGVSGGGSGGGGFWSTLLNIGAKFVGGLAGGIGVGSAVSGVSSGVAGAAAGITGGASSGIASGFFSALGGRASGGEIMQSGIYRYGELGAEPVFANGYAYLPKGATVQNNYQMRESANNNAPIMVTVNVNGVQNPQQFAQSKDQIAAQLQSAVARAQRNN